MYPRHSDCDNLGTSQGLVWRDAQVVCVGRPEDFAWRATPPPVIIYLVSKSEQVQLVDVKWGSGERSSPHLCISQTVALRTDTCRQEQDRGWDGSGPCITLGPEDLSMSLASFLCSWAGPEAGLGNETLRWRRGHGRERKRKM